MFNIALNWERDTEDAVTEAIGFTNNHPTPLSELSTVQVIKMSEENPYTFQSDVYAFGES